jgi:hypothetical protein
MTLRTFGTGSLSLQEIQTEFGGNSLPPGTQLSEYYAGGSYVPAGTVGYPTGGSTQVAIPSAGTISIANFYGATSVSIVQITTGGTWVVPTGITSVRVLVVGGGGGGGYAGPADGGGGGGAGGILYSTAYTVTPGASVSVNIGAGGAGASGGDGTNGTSTTFGTLIAVGGGGGGGLNGTGFGHGGGSGGGGCGYNSGVSGNHAGGAGTSGQGNSGGGAGEYNSGGGGGGYAAVGQWTEMHVGIQSVPGKGGTGLTIILPTNSAIYPYNATTHTYGTSFTATSLQVGGGGGGGQGFSLAPGGAGNGGGGAGGVQGVAGASGVAQSGGGGGGGGTNNSVLGNGGNGGSGVVYIIYPTIPTVDGVVPNYDAALAVNDYSDVGNTVTAGITLNSNGTTSVVTSPGGAWVSYSLGQRWYSTTITGIGNTYYAYATVVTSYSSSATGSFSGTFNSWVPLSAGQTWALINTPLPQPAFRYGVSDRYAVLATITITIAATVGGTPLSSSTVVLSTVSSQEYVVDPTPITCFPAGSMVMMGDGSQKAIELVAVGDIVMGITGPTPVIDWHSVELSSRDLLKFTDDDSHRWTYDHMHWTRRKSTGQQNWWTGNKEAFQREIDAEVGYAGPTVDTLWTDTENLEFATVNGWKEATVEVAHNDGPETQVYWVQTNDTPIIVDGYVVNSGLGLGLTDYSKMDWNTLVGLFRKTK